MKYLNSVLPSYIECALWSSMDDSGEPLDSGEYTLSDKAREQMREDCQNFIAYCEEEGIDSDAWSDEQFGHDFWLTRNGHGTGFWDRGLPNGDKLTAAAKTFGSCDLYVGDDNLVYVS